MVWGKMNAVYRFRLTQNASANGIKSSNVLKIKENYVIMMSSFEWFNLEFMNVIRTTQVLVGMQI